MNKTVHATGVIFEDEQGEILVLHRRAGNPEGDTWGLTGGKAEPGESGKSAAIRKVKAEIGHIINSDDLEFIKTYHWDRSDLDITFDVFRLKLFRPDVTLQIDPLGHTKYMWASPIDLYNRTDLMQGLYPIIKDTYHIQ